MLSRGVGDPREDQRTRRSRGEFCLRFLAGITGFLVAARELVLVLIRLISK